MKIGGQEQQATTEPTAVALPAIQPQERHRIMQTADWTEERCAAERAAIRQRQEGWHEATRAEVLALDLSCLDGSPDPERRLDDLLKRGRMRLSPEARLSWSVKGILRVHRTTANSGQGD